MGDYLDNNSNDDWEWKVGDGKAIIEVDHGDHTHKLDLTDVTIDEISENTNQTLGDCHRKSDHYPKD